MSKFEIEKYTPTQIRAMAEAIEDRLAYLAGTATEMHVHEPRRLPPPLPKREVPPPAACLDLGGWFPWQE